MTRRSLITILDALVIVLASAAIVIWLGGRTDTTLLGMRVLLRSAWRPALFAVTLGVVRFGVAPRVSVLPALRDGVGTTALDREKARFVAAPATPRTLWLYAAGAVAGSLVWLTPQLVRPRTVTDYGDPIFSAWRLGRFAEQLAHDPRHLFDGRIFHPAAGTLTYSDATVLEGVIAAPFILAGADPLMVSNVLTVTAFPLNALAFFYAAWRLTRDARAAVVAGLLGALHPFHWEHYSHLELQFTCFIPIALVALLSWLAKPTIRRGAMLGLVITLQWLACMYFGLMLLTFLVPFGLTIAIGWRVWPGLILTRSFACAATIVLTGFVALGLPYVGTRSARGDRPFELVAFFSAQPGEYLHPTSRLASYQWISREHNRLEREMLPGIALVTLAGIGIVPPLASTTVACLTSGAAAFDWSLGSNGLTYDDLYRRVLPFRGLRVPSRFSIFFGSALVLLAAVGSARLFKSASTPGFAAALFGLAIAVVLVDTRPHLQLVDYWRSVPSIYSAVPPNAVLAEFPFDHNTDYMYFSLSHRGRLFNGYSGFVPVPYVEAQNQLGDFPAASSFDALRRIGVTHVTVNCRFYGARCARVVDGLDAAAGVRLIASGKWEGAGVRLYELH